MSKVATAAGVTTNTIYWYFDDKDALLVAVLDRVLATALAEAALEPHRPWADEVLWAVNRLEQYRRLVPVVPARTTTSATIDSRHKPFPPLGAPVLDDGFRLPGVPATRLL